MAQSCYKSYANVRSKSLEFQVIDRVFLKVSPSKGIACFGKRGKLNPKFVGPFEVIGRVGVVAYRLNFPPELANVHNVFHVSLLQRYLSDPSHIITPEPLEVQKDFI